MYPGLVLPWREIGLGSNQELSDSTIKILSRPFLVQHGIHEGLECCRVLLHGKRQLMPVENIRNGVRMSHAMRKAQTLVACRPAEITEAQAQYTARYRAIEAVWSMFESVYGDGDPSNEQRRRRAFAQDFGHLN